MPKPYILTRENLNPTARLLAKNLGVQKSFVVRNYAPIIRWGNSDHEKYDNDTAYNPAEIIHIASNKRRFSEAMKILNIPHVEINSGVPKKFPVVIRHNLSASRGVGIEVVENPYQCVPTINGEEGNLEPTWNSLYWSYWRDFKFELGVHFFDGEILKIFKKVEEQERIYQGMEDSQIEFEKKYSIRNASRGWHFSLVDVSHYPKLVTLVTNFCNQFGMRFGRLDVGWNAKEKIYEIIEANSAPSLCENENTLNLYLERFKNLMQKGK